MTFKRRHFYIALILSIFVHVFVLTVLFVKPIEKKKEQFTELKIKLGIKRITQASNEVRPQNRNTQSQIGKRTIVRDSKPQKIVKRRIKKYEEASSLIELKDDEKDIKTINQDKENSALTAKKQQPTQDKISQNEQKKEKMLRKMENASRKMVVPELEIKSIPQPVTRKLLPGTVGSVLGNTLDENADDLVAYEQMLPLWLNNFREYPEEARLLGLQGIGVVHMKISRNGKVLLYKVKKSTGHPLLDKALMKMIADADPVIPVPPDYYPDRKSFSYEISFEFVN